ncbi:uncharacterized protein Z520_03863 [Fonsecaea multimorphosa CBS 102226]|uniref:Uncharacterized protein n=1 Tax=Fonsecaea multimorphosa CBS 102226 TaxID=1442371 RepID=A0A0D2K2V1_9EURO|nr:uncharacterized protein Z520_03863 [Fonsecaea multimorphosa CBS 102226]KIY00178.1 hypothetical protein Z520_03863 [Fonsecaea multimorphosa CBS 102226]OAL27374.1 hypothetical protein AYO22_03649 [Fonsecaea multimorphosa]
MSQSDKQSDKAHKALEGFRLFRYIIRFLPLLILGLIVALTVILLVGWLVLLVAFALAGLGVISVATANALRRAILAPVVFLYQLTRKILRRRRTLEPVKRARITPLSDAEVTSFQTTNNPGLQVLLLQQKAGGSCLMLAYSHYADYMRLFGLSKYVRQALQSSVDHGVENIRKMTCSVGEKSECWACRGQICSTCTVPREVASPGTSHHLDECETICSRCYLGHLYSKSKRFKPSKDQQCSHRVVTTDISTPERGICSSCALDGDEKIVVRRWRKELMELINIEAASVACWMCHKHMRSGTPRWWICSTCGNDCTSSLHASWVEVKPRAPTLEVFEN